MPSLFTSAPTNFGVAVYPPGATFGPRRLLDWELVWLIEGDAEYEWNGQSVAAPAGSMVLCRPPVTDFFRWDAQKRTRHGFFHFLIEEIPASWPTPGDWPLVRATDENDILRPLFRHLLTWAGKGDAVATQIALAHLVAAFVTGENAIDAMPSQNMPDAMARALDWMQKRLEDEPAAPISLAELARAACVTPEHLCRVFKAAGQPSPVETVRLARLDRAATLLARSNYSIAEIAHLCGFADALHFSRRFKAAFGRAPSEMRRAVQNGATPPLSRLIRTFRTSISDI